MWEESITVGMLNANMALEEKRVGSAWVLVTTEMSQIQK